MSGNDRVALESLVVRCLRSGRPEEAERHLRALVSRYPAEPRYCDRLATLLERRGRAGEAIACYRKLLRKHPGYTNSRYNLARLLKRSGHPEKALKTYRQCLAAGIEQAEEVHTNISVIHTESHRHEEAKQALQQALAINPTYLPALYNLALLREELGDWSGARSLFSEVLQLDPRHSGALSHIANGEKVAEPVAPIIRQMKRALRQPDVAEEDREELLYALGKAHDDCRHFDRAFDYYQQANQLSRKRTGSYDRSAHESLVGQLAGHCTSEWLAAIEPVSDRPLVFICGMFRSGSTLLEQILAAHPAMTPGGEIDYFQQALAPFPRGVITAQPGALPAIGQGYLDHLARHFPAGARVINKRPDNFLCLALLKALYPNVRIINTLRQPLDNCLSLYFQPLAAAQAYANGLLDAGHYYGQYRKLLGHWRDLLGDNLLDVRYEALVENPRDTIATVLAFLQLEWHEGCLDFHRADNRVRTASVNQVRQPLYAGSSGRWQNYDRQLRPLRDYLLTLPRVEP